MSCCSFLEKKKKKDIVADLHLRGYDSDPIKAWKKSLQTESTEERENEEGEEETGELDYNYLLTMPLLSLSLEKVDELLKNKEKKVTIHYIQSLIDYNGTVQTNITDTGINWTPNSFSITEVKSGHFYMYN